MTEPDPGTGTDDEAELTFIGTATVLIRFAGFTILTDPNFLHRGELAPLGWGLRSRRLTEPAMMMSELPPLDLIVLSHHHGDHFDPVAVRALNKRLPIVTGRAAAAKLRRQGFGHAIGLRTWQTRTVARGAARLTITSMPGVHAPFPIRFFIPPVMGAMLDFSRDDEPLLRLYITGDTLMHPALGEVGRRYPDIDVCLIHLGGTRIGGILLTMDAGQGLRALENIRPRHAVPIHHDDYTVFRSPIEDFVRIVAESTMRTEVRTIARGETLRYAAGKGDIRVG